MLGDPDVVFDSQGDAIGQAHVTLVQPEATTGPNGRSSSPEQDPTSDGMAYLRSRLQSEGWSEEVTRTVVEAWAPETIRKYKILGISGPSIVNLRDKTLLWTRFQLIILLNF